MILKYSFYLLLLFTIGIDSLEANIGVPMIYVTFPAMLYALVPIICIETWILFHQLQLDFWEVCKSVTIANAFSTIIGLPITWVLLVIFSSITGGSRGYGLNSPIKKLLAVTWQASWLIPYSHSLYWMVPAAGLFLLIPFFFASWFSENLVIQYFLPNVEASTLSDTVFYANAITYAILAFLTICVLIYRLLHKPEETDDDY